jgi:hypothetical protein
MGVGLGSGVNVSVGGSCVGVREGVVVIVTVAVLVEGTITSGVERNAKYTRTAPIIRKIAIKPMAAGNESEMDGILPP